MLGDYASSCGSWSLYSATGNIPMALSEAIIATYISSLKARNGVGVRADGKVIFAISQGDVSFDAFARLFRDGLSCPNALFLDGGSASSFYVPSLNSHDNILSLGPLLAVFERDRGAGRQ